MEADKDENFGNGRSVRNFFEKVLEKQAMRVTTLLDATDDDFITIEKEDIIPYIPNSNNEKVVIKEKKIGFI